jgi:hypothetical protein
MLFVPLRISLSFRRLFKALPLPLDTHGLKSCSLINRGVLRHEFVVSTGGEIQHHWYATKGPPMLQLSAKRALENVPMDEPDFLYTIRWGYSSTTLERVDRRGLHPALFWVGVRIGLEGGIDHDVVST